MTTKVMCRFLSPIGEPLVNAEAVFQLSKSGYSEDETGIVMPRPITVLTNVYGEVEINLWPGNHIYHVTVDDPEHDVSLHYKFVVPEVEVAGTSVRLQDIVVDGELSNTEWDTAAILAIQNAKANAMAAQVAAEAAAASVGTSVSMVQFEVQRAINAADDLDAARQAASQSAIDASNARIEAVSASAAAQMANASAVQAATNAQTAAGVAQALAPYIGPTPPPNPIANSTWLDSTTGIRYYWFVDANSAQWVQDGGLVHTSAGGGGSGGSLPLGGSTGQVLAKYDNGDGLASWKTLAKTDVGLDNVNNTADLNKPISNSTQAALNLKAPLASPAFTGNPTAPTPSPGDSDTSIATTAYVTNAINGLIGGSTSIDDGSVTLAKLANQTSKTVIGRTSASTGPAEEVTMSQLKADLSLDKADVGLGNVDNTSDANKPVSTAQRTALNTLASNIQTGNYTLVTGDAGGAVRMTSTSANTLTVPPNSSQALPIDTTVIVEQYGAGVTTISAGAGVTLRSRGGSLAIGGQYGAVVLHKLTTNEWLVMGDLA